MRPNILYLHSHDTGRWVQPYGFPVAMPAYGAFARDGVRFADAHCAGPTCSPSRAGLLTGQAPHRAGMIGLAHRGFALRDPRQHLVHTLHAAGYHSLLCGIQHVMPSSDQIGYREILTDRHWEAEERAVARLRAGIAEPFFLDVGFFETHRPFPPPAPDIDRAALPLHGLPDLPAVREDLAAYATMARALDRRVGAVLAALAQAGQAERTIVVLTTDHGPAFPGMKCQLNALGTGVLLMLRGPGIAAGRRVDGLVAQIDLFPTLCDLTGIAHPPWLQGRSFAPALRGDPWTPDEAVFSEVTYHAAYEPQRAIRTRDHLYIRRFPAHDRPILPNCDGGPSKAALLATAWPRTPLAMEVLHDLRADPGERRDVLADPDQREALAALRARLSAWMAANDDPLRAGFVAAPPGACMCPVDQVDFEDGDFIVGPAHAGRAALRR